MYFVDLLLNIWNISFLVFIFIYIFFLPGYLISKLFFKQIRFYEYIAVSLALSILIVPIVNFSFAWVMHTFVSVGLVLVSITAINMIFLLILIKKKASFKINSFKVKNINKELVALFVICLIIFFFYLYHFEGPAVDYWSTYIVAPSILMNNEYVKYTDIDGSQLYNYELKNSVPENLIGRGSYGISSKDQRIGASILFSVPYTFFGISSFRLFNALILVLAFLLLYSIINHLSGSILLGILGGIIAVLNPLIIYFNRLNANILAFMIICLFLYFLIRRESYLLAGITLGILGGIRNEALVFIPGIIVFIYYKSKHINRQFFQKIIIFGIGAFVFILPILLWNTYAFGNIFMHPTQYQGLDGFRPTFEHQLMGINFEFNGLLNYPFYKEVVRTPHFPFPIFIILPLVLIKSFGILLISLMFIGVYGLIKQYKNIGIMLLLFSIVFLLLLLPMENWEELKTSYLILLIPFISVFIIFGLNELIREIKEYKISNFCLYEKSKKRIVSINKSILLFILIMIIIFVFIMSLRYLEFKKDMRWYERFPHSTKNEVNINGLPVELRKDWYVFYTDETKNEYLKERSRFLDIGLLPRLYAPTKSNFEYNKFVKGFNERGIEIIDYWGYIYSNI